MHIEQLHTEIVEQNWELVKFNGEPPAPGELKEPVEIMQGGDNKRTAVTYRQGEGDTIKWFTGSATGNAVLAREEPRLCR